MSGKARTVAEFRSVHDRSVVIPNKIRAALAELLKVGPEHYEYEVEFMKRLQGVSVADMGMYRDQFEEYVLEVQIPGKGSNKRKVWFGDKKVAAKLRG